MSDKPVTRLAGAFDFHLSEILRYDLAVGVVGGAAGVCAAFFAPESLSDGAAVVGTMVGVVIGAVIAGVAVQGAFLDQPFLRKLRAIGSDPVRHMAPFLFTAALGVVAALAIITLAFLPETAPTAVLAPVAGFAGLTSFWTLASLLPCLDTLVQFVRLRDDAAMIPDDIQVPREPTKAARQRH